jgi:hypothetical protein
MDRGGRTGTVQAAEQHSGLTVDLRLNGFSNMRIAGDLAGSAVIRTAQTRVRGQEPGGAASIQGRHPKTISGHLALLPQHGEPAQGAGPLGGLEPAPVMVGELGQADDLGPCLVIDSGLAAALCPGSDTPPDERRPPARPAR